MALLVVLKIWFVSHNLFICIYRAFKNSFSYSVLDHVLRVVKSPPNLVFYITEMPTMKLIFATKQMAFFMIQMIWIFSHYFFTCICRAYKNTFFTNILVHGLGAVKKSPKNGSGTFWGAKNYIRRGHGRVKFSGWEKRLLRNINQTFEVYANNLKAPFDFFTFSPKRDTF